MCVINESKQCLVIMDELLMSQLNHKKIKRLKSLKDLKKKASLSITKQGKLMFFCFCFQKQYNAILLLL